MTCWPAAKAKNEQVWASIQAVVTSAERKAEAAAAVKTLLEQVFAGVIAKAQAAMVRGALHQSCALQILTNAYVQEKEQDQDEAATKKRAHVSCFWT